MNKNLKGTKVKIKRNPKNSPLHTNTHKEKMMEQIN